MCGIVGFLDKRGNQKVPLGRTLLTMLQALSCRGPDSAGVALFGPSSPHWIAQVSLPEDPRHYRTILDRFERWEPDPEDPIARWDGRGRYLRLEMRDRELPDAANVEDFLLTNYPGIEVVSLGHSLEIIKQVGSPDDLERHYGIARRAGSHGIGHTRLSTESRVDLSHSQPFGAHGVPDLATVHNGHITNYHKLRRRFEQEGYRFYTENDSEVIGVYLRDRMAAGRTLEGALQSSLEDFDGSFCYLAASKDRLGFVKDRFGFKPLVLAETDDFVAVATEEIALRQALGHDFTTHEPAPGTIRIWSIGQETSRADVEG